MNRILIVFVLLLGTSRVFSQPSSLSEMPMKTLGNESVKLSDYLGKGPVYITFWALWCEPCKTELRYLQKIHEKYSADGLTILAINHDTQKSLAKVQPYIAAKGYTFTVIIDPDFEIFQKLNGEQLPYSLLFDPKGIVVTRRTGFLPGDERDIEKEIKEVLEKVSKSEKAHE